MKPNEASAQQVLLFKFIDAERRGLMDEEDFLFPNY